VLSVTKQPPRHIRPHNLHGPVHHYRNVYRHHYQSIEPEVGQFRFLYESQAFSRKEGIKQRVSYSDSAKEAFASYIGRFVASAISPAFPYHLGVFIPIASILASATDIGQSTGPALLGAFVTMFLAYIFQDQITLLLSIVAVIVGFASLLARSGSNTW